MVIREANKKSQKKNLQEKGKMRRLILFLSVIAILIVSPNAFSSNQKYYFPTSPQVTTINKTIGIALIIGGVLLFADGVRTRTNEWDFLVWKYWYNYDTDESYSKWYTDSDYDTIEYTWSKSWEEDNVYYDYTYNHHKKEYSETWEIIAGLAVGWIGYRVYKGEISPIKVTIKPKKVKVAYVMEIK